MLLPIVLLSFVAASLIEDINNNPKSTWKAKDYSPDIITYKKMMSMLGEIFEMEDAEKYVEPENLPESFDAREQWPGKIYGSYRQSACGSCWAFTTAETVSDRFAINGCPKGMLSVQDLVSCDSTDFGCEKGNATLAYKWVIDHGITTEDCIPYVSGSGRIPQCPQKCVNGSFIKRYKAKKLQHFTVNQIQQELCTNGPVYARFMIYLDFMNYEKGIYQHASKTACGGHAVPLIGWGVENGIPYWILQNSWGDDWGENGFFRMLRGANECGVESNFYSVSVEC
ncbi:putative cathepsin B6 cysteine protease [Monocercomonoides exilis]|uniref:putative cathepsin B6 cysteine protease n=1 Tax=Monocercomonoides exilis TaxID=2049356 RepID=UPI0035593B3B|nr:putative cathepsin B6 cysteine protease [Monocercomonoides exilis]|eukprot:MONOS_9413.1-p1 / transcript=MONOS_9413.1 / gene=MONOS_9413 / organism=Monocercomonoides_exilis_PA203 / gene_product=cathepsin B6 cysteine protease / transcript_product=cathepsin B6 cysteine protease / location=Mono_scaffold00388:23742-24590(-) / protein_length=282 / sequence_SO=supercontig / SO=protein_coding / is_pseudo=false